MERWHLSHVRKYFFIVCLFGLIIWWSRIQTSHNLLTKDKFSSPSIAGSSLHCSRKSIIWMQIFLLMMLRRNNLRFTNLCLAAMDMIEILYLDTMMSGSNKKTHVWKKTEHEQMTYFLFYFGIFFLISHGVKAIHLKTHER